MITQIVQGELDYVNVSVACVDGTGARIDPTVAIATFFRLNQEDGSLERAMDVGLNGVVSLAQQGGETGFWGTGVDVSDAEAGLFVVLFEITYAGGVAVALDTIYIQTYDSGAPTPAVAPSRVDATEG